MKTFGLFEIKDLYRFSSNHIPQVLRNGDPFIILSVEMPDGELTITNLNPDTEYTVRQHCSSIIGQPPYMRLWLLLYQVSGCQNPLSNYGLVHKVTYCLLQ